MSISNGQKVDATNSNAAWMSRTSNTSTVGVVSLQNTTDPESGDEISNLQKSINLIFDTVGIDGEDDPGPTSYESDNYLVSGEDHKYNLERLDEALGAIDTDAFIPFDGSNEKQYLYIGHKDSDDSFRLIIDSGSLKIEKRISGSWITLQSLS